MQNYETNFILDPLLDDEKITAMTDEYSDFLAKNGCSVIKSEKWGRKKFAYPIRNKLAGNYVSIEFQGTPDSVSKLERTFQLDENVLRYLTVSFDKKTLRERQEYFEKKQQFDAERERAAAAAREPQPAPETQEESAQVAQS